MSIVNENEKLLEMVEAAIEAGFNPEEIVEAARARVAAAVNGVSGEGPIQGELPFVEVESEEEVLEVQGRLF